MNRRTASKLLTVAASLALAASSWSAVAADAGLSRILPRGGQRGTELEVTFAGKNLKDAQEVLFFQPGITVKEIKPGTDGASFKATLAIAPDAKLGEHAIRVRTATGMSDLRTFFVGPFATVEEVEPNSEFGTPQKI